MKRVHWTIRAAAAVGVILGGLGLGGLGLGGRDNPVSTSRDSAGGPPITRGVNFGNMLEAPSEGDWGLTVRDAFFERVAKAGMDHVRLPVSWDGHQQQSAPYTIDARFMDRVNECVDQALAHGLKVIVNVHHDDALNKDPRGEEARALATWEQIATRMRGRPDGVYFEVLNEPHGAFNEHPELWDQYLAKALAVIRRTNPTRWVFAGPVRWNSVGALAGFTPPRDPKLVVTVHYYEPFAFTHQGAEWIKPTPPVGQAWSAEARWLAGPWENWSWDTRLVPDAAGLKIEFQKAWAGFSVHRASAHEGVKRIVFRLESPARMKVTVQHGDTRHELAEPRAAGAAAPGTWVVDVPVEAAVVDRINFQNATNGPAPAVVFASLLVESGDGAEEVIATQGDAITRAMTNAAEWGKRHGTPMHLGEFGSYSRGDMASRAEWTRAVRTAAEHAGMPWSYWEFGAGFGIYDPKTDTWREPLLKALLGE